MAKNRIARTELGKLAIVVGILCLVTAVGFGLAQTVHVSTTRDQAVEAPSTTSAGASCGLAIAGGLCFVAAAIAESGAGSPRPPADGGGPSV